MTQAYIKTLKDKDGNIIYPQTSLNAVTGAHDLSLADLNEDENHRTVTDIEKATWNGKSNFSGSYNDLTNKPTIPVVTDAEKTAWNGKSVVSVSDTGTSNSQIKYITIDGTEWKMGGSSEKFITGTLAIGQTLLELPSEEITSDSMIDIYTSVYGVNPINVEITSAGILLVFESQGQDIDVKVAWR